ncbi:MAG: PIN domain-containing protein [Candidatus Electrothrix sp. AR3]|nr:PIN domain-containing protein [Candidatus Electrothrix sp. AR3]
MKIYLDVCCLNRPFDDQTQDRVHLEAEAVLSIFKRLEKNDWSWVSSSVVLYEVNQIPNNDRKHRILRLCDKASYVVTLDDDIYALAEKLKHLGIKSYDALHLSCAKKAGADVFLSTDDKLVKRSQKNQGMLDMTVDNPLNWLKKIW